jgi:hypothetical protein
MNDQPTTILGIFIPTSDPVFLRIVFFHIVVGLICVVTGLGAMFSKKARGRHSLFGSVYFWGLLVLVGSASVLAFMRWEHNRHLFFLGWLSFLFACVGRAAIRKKWTQRFRFHIPAFGVSYIFMLIAFYVDNGPHLPVWKHFHPVFYWLLPVVIGIPLILRAMTKYRSWK